MYVQEEKTLKYKTQFHESNGTMLLRWLTDYLLTMAVTQQSMLLEHILDKQ